jgi:aspartyl aminopeptidase
LACRVDSSRQIVAGGFELLELATPWSDARSWFVSRRCAGRLNRGGPHCRTPQCAWSVHIPTPVFESSRSDTGGAGWKQLGVEVYGGALINSWSTDLGIAGRSN